MKTCRIFFLVVCSCLANQAVAEEHRLDLSQQGPPTDELSAEIAAQLSSTGFSVVRGTSRTVCEVWLCKQWEVSPDFRPTSEVLYPFKPGQLIGAARFPRKGGDFRGQDIEAGVYTLRYAQQPIDGAHVGTSPTRDFVLLVKAKQDQSVAGLDMKALIAKSAEAAQSSHPAMLCLQRVQDDSGDGATLREDDEHEWCIVTFQGTTRAGDAAAKLSVAIVVVGESAE